MCLPPISTLFPYTTLFRSPSSNSLSLSSIALYKSSNEGKSPAASNAPLVTSRVFIAKPRSDQWSIRSRSEEHTSELQSLRHFVCCLLLEKKIYLIIYFIIQ